MTTSTKIIIIVLTKSKSRLRFRVRQRLCKCVSPKCTFLRRCGFPIFGRFEGDFYDFQANISMRWFVQASAMNRIESQKENQNNVLFDIREHWNCHSINKITFSLAPTVFVLRKVSTYMSVEVMSYLRMVLMHGTWKMLNLTKINILVNFLKKSTDRKLVPACKWARI